MKVKLSIAVVLVAVAVALATAPAQARNPRPDCAPPAKPHCHITWVAYDYDDYGRDQFGNTYWRLCHVSRRGKHTCTAWVLLRDAFPIRHAGSREALRRQFGR